MNEEIAQTNFPPLYNLRFEKENFVPRAKKSNLAQTPFHEETSDSNS